MTAFKPGDRVHLKDHAHAPATTGTVEDVTPFRVYVRWDDCRALTPHDYETLEPAGEPMSKTFKSATYEGCELTIKQIPSGSYVRTKVDGIGVSKFIVSPDDAPALALAILEAAGEPMAPEVARAMEALEEYKQRTQAEAEDAADREKLDSEALDLYNRVMRSGKEPLSEWLSTLQFTRIKYTNIAKAARERYGVTK